MSPKFKILKSVAFFLISIIVYHIKHEINNKQKGIFKGWKKGVSSLNHSVYKNAKVGNCPVVVNYDCCDIFFFITNWTKTGTIWL